jgi:conjugative transfer signal peptidase TraF
MTEQAHRGAEASAGAAPELPLVAHASDRRFRLSSTRPRQRRFAVVAAGIALIGVTVARPPSPRLVWNASASAPIGLYAVTRAAVLERGDLVIAWPPAAVRAIAARRHYLPANVPLVKRIPALGGDRVCAIGGAIFVNGRVLASRLKHDRLGRTMPWWSGCIVLAKDDVLLLNAATGSFDGRYFGPSRRSDVIGKATPLWVR